jgi:hypothetical protein
MNLVNMQLNFLCTESDIPYNQSAEVSTHTFVYTRVSCLIGRTNVLIPIDSMCCDNSQCLS